MSGNNECPGCHSIDLVIARCQDDLFCGTCGFVIPSPCIVAITLPIEDPAFSQRHGRYENPSRREETNSASGESKGQETRNAQQTQEKASNNNFNKCKCILSEDVDFDPTRTELICQDCRLVLPDSAAAIALYNNYLKEGREKEERRLLIEAQEARNS